MCAGGVNRGPRRPASRSDRLRRSGGGGNGGAGPRWRRSVVRLIRHGVTWAGSHQRGGACGSIFSNAATTACAERAGRSPAASASATSGKNDGSTSPVRLSRPAGARPSRAWTAASGSCCRERVAGSAAAFFSPCRRASESGRALRCATSPAVVTTAAAAGCRTSPRPDGSPAGRCPTPPSARPRPAAGDRLDPHHEAAGLLRQQRRGRRKSCHRRTLPAATDTAPGAGGVERTKSRKTPPTPAAPFCRHSIAGSPRRAAPRSVVRAGTHVPGGIRGNSCPAATTPARRSAPSPERAAPVRGPVAVVGAVLASGQAGPPIRPATRPPIASALLPEPEP
ncbi:MAG: hypothetical protein JWP66_794 [Naasia sp.]|nr:hypothetical protein [Naasia sp.]